MIKALARRVERFKRNVLGGDISIANPNVPISELNFGGAFNSATGITVGESQALSYPPVFRALSLLSWGVAKLPLTVYRIDPSGKSADSAHPASYLLKEEANAEQNAYVFWMTMVYRYLLWGNAYAYISRNAAGEPVELIPLPTDTFVAREGKQLLYVTQADGQQFHLYPSDVIHLKGIGDGLVGKSLLEHATEAFGLGLAAQRYNAYFFKNLARPSVVISHPETISPELEDSIRRNWDKSYRSIENQHKTAILQEGMKLEVVSANNRDSQLAELRKLSILDVSNYFGIPPHMLGHEINSSYKSLTEQSLSLLTHSFDPILVNVESETKSKLLTSSEKRLGTHTVSFERREVIRMNPQARAVYYGKGIQDGWLLPEEVRAMEGLNPLPENDS